MYKNGSGPISDINFVFFLVFFFKPIFFVLGSVIVCFVVA